MNDIEDNNDDLQRVKEKIQATEKQIQEKPGEGQRLNQRLEQHMQFLKQYEQVKVDLEAQLKTIDTKSNEMKDIVDQFYGERLQSIARQVQSQSKVMNTVRSKL